MNDGYQLPRFIPEDCPLYKQVLDVGRHFGVEATEEFKELLSLESLYHLCICYTLSE